MELINHVKQTKFPKELWETVCVVQEQHSKVTGRKLWITKDRHDGKWKQTGPKKDHMEKMCNSIRQGRLTK